MSIEKIKKKVLYCISNPKEIFKKLKYKIKTNKTYKLVFIILICSVGLAVLMGYKNKENTRIKNNTLIRPDPGNESVNKTLDIYDDTGNLITSIDLELQPRELNEEEIEDFFLKAYYEISDVMLKNNDSIDEVKSDLKLINEACDGVVSVSWYSEDYEIINYNGKVDNYDMSEGDTKKVKLRAILEYEEFKTSYDFDITVVPNLQRENKLENQIAKQIKNVAAESKENSELILPNEINGKSVAYRLKKSESSPFYYIFLGCMSVALLFYNDRLKVKKQKEDRDKQMKYDYSEVVSKLTLLLGSGMTIRMAWRKICMDYRNNLQKGKIVARAIYDEMYETECNIEAGISEAVAYERFASRINIKEYTKLASLLESNLKKGSRDLIILLENETREAFELRKQLALKKGEEASTKLLMPMIIMLVIVMAIIMVPAVSSFGV